MATIRALIAVTSIHQWHISQMDVKNIFFNGDVKEGVHMSISTSHIHYPLYVDDIIIIGNDVDGIAMLKTKLAQPFNVKDLGPLHYFLVIEVLCIGIEPLKRCKDENQRKKSNNKQFCMVMRNFAHHEKPLEAAKGFRTPCQISHDPWMSISYHLRAIGRWFKVRITLNGQYLSREKTLAFIHEIFTISAPHTRKSHWAEDHGVYKIYYDFGVIYIDWNRSENTQIKVAVAMAPFDSRFDPRQRRHLIRAHLVSQLIRVQLVLLD
uniref:Reverse transcriptase Ty1/copia-type domain-containing protein n=1 Tax=Vitis vinifera TaxID=29760 RepID=A5BWG5_VITVI|nr:hypothetical protein VITISV_030220 [Vitis vinifera]